MRVVPVSASVKRSTVGRLREETLNRGVGLELDLHSRETRLDSSKLASSAKPIERFSQSETKREHPPSSYDDSGLFHIYLREIRAYNLLSRAEEADLAQRIQAGDEQARQTMINCNLRLVVKIAHEFEGYALSLLDLISEGNLGLMKAVRRFDHRRGTRLSTYAAFYIKQAMRRAIHNQSRVIRLPIHIHERIQAMDKTCRRLREEMGREPSDSELARAMGLKPKTLAKCRASAQYPVSLQESLEENETRTNEESIGDEHAVLPGNELEQEESMAAVRSVLHTLSDREQVILRLRFGFHDSPGMTLDEVGARLGLTRERIRQIEHAALRKLRLRLNASEQMTA